MMPWAKKRAARKKSITHFLQRYYVASALPHFAHFSRFLGFIISFLLPIIIGAFDSSAAIGLENKLESGETRLLEDIFIVDFTKKDLFYMFTSFERGFFNGTPESRGIDIPYRANSDWGTNKSLNPWFINKFANLSFLMRSKNISWAQSPSDFSDYTSGPSKIFNAHMDFIVSSKRTATSQPSLFGSDENIDAPLHLASLVSTSKPQSGRESCYDQSCPRCNDPSMGVETFHEAKNRNRQYIALGWFFLIAVPLLFTGFALIIIGEQREYAKRRKQYGD